MQWLTYMLGVKHPEETWLKSAELGFRGLFSAWLLIPIVLAMVAGVFLLYFRERSRIGPVRRSFLALLRVGVLVFLLLLLFRPVLLTTFEGERQRSIILLVDDSQSMKQADRRMTPSDRGRVAIANGLVNPKTDLDQFVSIADLPDGTPKDPLRIEMVKAVLDHPKLKLPSGLQERGPLRPYLFGEKLFSVVVNPEKGDASEKLSKQIIKLIDGNQEKTALANHVLDILEKKEGDLPAAMVVMTDGQINADYLPLAEAAEECARAGVPLHIYGVGSTEGGILRLTDVDVRSTVFYKDKVVIPVHWRAQGFKEGTVRLLLKLNGETVDQKELPVQNDEHLRHEFELIPEQAKADKDAENQLQVSIELKGNPLFKDEVKQPVFVSDKKLKVLYVEGTPRWEYKFLDFFLKREMQSGRVDANFILTQGDPKRLNQLPFLPEFPKREKLLEYDLVILGDVPASYLGPKNMELIKEFVREFRGGLIVIAGTENAPSSWDGTPLAELLPVEFLPLEASFDPNERFEAYKPVLTPAGEASAMLDLTEAEGDEVKKGERSKEKKLIANRDIWENQLPGFYWHFKVRKLRPGAVSLLAHPFRKMDKEAMPILAMHYYGGPVLFLATDETWRWRKNEENRYFAQFWGQAIYQIGSPHLMGNQSRKVKISVDRGEAILNRKGFLYARLLDEQFQPITKEKVPATITYLDAKNGQPRTEKVMFEKVPSAEGRYRLLRAHDQQGRFEVKIDGMEGYHQYLVKAPPRHELDEAPLAEEALRQAASLSGGDYYREEDLHRLPTNVKEQTTPFTLHQEILLWNPLVFLLFLALITTEWILRKFSNMS